MTRLRQKRFQVWGLLAVVCLPGAKGDADPSYFPPRAFVLEDRPSYTNDISGMLAEQYSAVLRTMDEPSLWELSKGDRSVVAYRFLWLPGFDSAYDPIAVRIEKTGRRVTLNAVQLGRDVGKEHGKIALNKQVFLTQEQWDRLTTLVDWADLWDMPAKINDQGLDGETLIVEGVSEGAYHVVGRWTPGPGAYRELCRGMLDLSGLNLGQKGWPAPPPSRAGIRISVGLLVLGLAALIAFAILKRVIRPRKPRPYVGLEEIV